LAITAAFSTAVSAKGKLTLYTYDSMGTELVKMMKTYMSKSQDCDLTVRTFEDTGLMYNQLLQERSKPVADIVLGLDNVDVVRAKADKLLQPYKPAMADKIRDGLVFDNSFYLTPFDYGFITFNYDSSKIKDVPTTFDELLSPKYKQKIVIENPMTSSPGQAFVFATIAKYGEAKYLDFWKKFKTNLLTMTPGWSAAYGMYTNGEVPMVLSYGTSPVVHLIYDKTEKYKAVALEDSAWAQIEGVGIATGTKNLAMSKKLIDYILGTDFQTALQEQQFMYPVREDVKLSPNFRVAVSAKNILNKKISVEKIAANRDKWLKDWEKVMSSVK
jgi:thiamine transport system substrate-binding protein